MKLHLGVIEQTEIGGASTFDVAEILDKKYTLFSGFVELHIDEIARHLEESVASSLDNLNQTGVAINPLVAATEEIEQDFRDYLEKEQIAELGVKGVPTKAALIGRSKRVKGLRGRRPSFIDTGTLQKSFKAWVE